jgi:Arc/MetJ-type ribon-helix-helix transcriptional regulator
MAKISVSLPDHLLTYLDSKVDNRSQLIETLLKEWQQQQENEALAKACELVDQLDLGWNSEWQSQAATDWEVSG